MNYVTLEIDIVLIGHHAAINSLRYLQMKENTVIFIGYFLLLFCILFAVLFF